MSEHTHPIDAERMHPDHAEAVLTRGLGYCDGVEGLAIDPDDTWFETEDLHSDPVFFNGHRVFAYRVWREVAEGSGAALRLTLTCVDDDSTSIECYDISLCPSSEKDWSPGCFYHTSVEISEDGNASLPPTHPAIYLSDFVLPASDSYDYDLESMPSLLEPVSPAAGTELAILVSLLEQQALPALKESRLAHLDAQMMELNLSPAASDESLREVTRSLALFDSELTFEGRDEDEHLIGGLSVLKVGATFNNLPLDSIWFSVQRHENRTPFACNGVLTSHDQQGRAVLVFDFSIQLDSEVSGRYFVTGIELDEDDRPIPAESQPHPTFHLDRMTYPSSESYGDFLDGTFDEWPSLSEENATELYGLIETLREVVIPRLQAEPANQAKYN